MSELGYLLIVGVLFFVAAVAVLVVLSPPGLVRRGDGYHRADGGASWRLSAAQLAARRVDRALLKAERVLARSAAALGNGSIG